MNKVNLQQIFSHYLEKFEYITDKNSNDENYKWFICKKFRKLMDEALEAESEVFASALYKAKAVTANLIDSFTQPFAGLVEFAKHEPETVREMFLNLYSDDEGDIHIQEALIADFFDKSNELLEKYTPGSYRYKQNSHSVSAYLFLYDPDNHYMYKASQSCIFADCIQYYDDWGTGDNIKLDVYYRMCDWLVEQIFECKELLATDASRFELPESAEMFEDKKKHLLAFDIIYACSVYDLFDGISFNRPKTKEKNLIIERKLKAQRMLDNYKKAMDNLDKLNEALVSVEKALLPGTLMVHKMFGTGELVSYSNGAAEVSFPIGNKKLGLAMVLSMGLVKISDSNIASEVLQYIPYLKDKDAIRSAFARAEKELEPYKEYLE